MKGTTRITVAALSGLRRTDVQRGIPEMNRTITAAAVIVGAVLVLTACSGGAPTASPTATAAPGRTSIEATAAPADTRVTVPSVMGLTSGEATTKLEAAGIKIKVTGETSNSKFVVLFQTPSSPLEVDKGETVTVVMGESPAQRDVRVAAEKAAAAKKAAAEKKEAERVAAEKAAAEAAAAAAAAIDADLTTYAATDDRGWQLVAKDPDAHVGEKYVVFGGVTQFDSATGTSAFRANTGGAQDDSSYVSVYGYDINTYVIGDAATLAQIVEDDLLKMYVKVEGSLSYDTQNGGNTTVPQVSIHGFELIGHAE